MESDSLSGRILEWAKLRGPDFARLDRDKTVVCVSCSPMEVHGPHLPMVTDSCEAEGLMKRTMEMILSRRPELTFVCLPPLYVSADVVPQVGSLAFRVSTIVDVLRDLGRSLAKQGFRHIWVSNFHGGPRHFTAIELGCHKTNQRYGTRMISVFGLLLNRLTGGNTDLSDILGQIEGIDAADLEGDTHGGLVETSLMLHLLGEHVDPGYKELSRMTVALKDEQLGRETKQVKGRPSLFGLVRSLGSKLKYYESESYAGHPAMASPEIGRAILEKLSGLSADALLEVYDGKIALKDCHSPLWRVRWLFTIRFVSWLLERATNYKSLVW